MSKSEKVWKFDFSNEKCLSWSHLSGNQVNTKAVIPGGRGGGWCKCSHENVLVSAA